LVKAVHRVVCVSAVGQCWDVTTRGW